VSHLSRDCLGRITVLVRWSATLGRCSARSWARRGRGRLAIAPVIADYVKADPSSLWEAAGATAAFVAAGGAYGYATRRDLSSWARTLYWALLALIVFGIVAIFVSIPNGHIIYAVAGLGIFGAFAIFDFNRLRRASADGAVVMAASIFLDIFSVFLLLVDMFGGTRE
jgi:FtsH-binding integral membrane protein